MAANKPFREDWQTSIPFLKGIVDWMNAIGHVLNNLSFSTGSPPKVLASKDGVKFVLPLGGADGITDMGGSWGFKIFATPHDEESDSELESPRDLPPRFSNLLRDGDGDESESDDDPGLFDVRVLGGPAQVLGGREHVFPDFEFEEPLVGGSIIYIRYRITDKDGNAVCKWDEDFQAYNPDEDPEEDNPFDKENEEEEGRSMVFALGAVGNMYENGVRQDRVGSILAIATINSSGVFVNPTAEELPGSGDSSASGEG